MAVSRQPAIHPEPSSGEGIDDDPPSKDTKWKRFHPMRVVRKIFRRRTKRGGTPVAESSKKSFSTSELLSVQDDIGQEKCDVTTQLKIGLSVSHDSIFPCDNTVNAMSSENLDVPRGSSMTVHHHSPLKTMFKDELFSRIRARRDSDDDDVGLPHSPSTSPTTVDVLNQGLKERTSKSKSIYSAGSLFSMGSSECDEDSAGHSSGHSSRMSLLDRRSGDLDVDMDFPPLVPLNHTAALHKIAIKPKRTHGLPRHRMNQVASGKISPLPTTPEVFEECCKMSQNITAVEIRNITENSVHLVGNMSPGLSNWQETLILSSMSCNEISDITKKVHSLKDKSCSQLFDSSSATTPCSNKTEKVEYLQTVENKSVNFDYKGAQQCNNKSDRLDIAKSSKHLISETAHSTLYNSNSIAIIKKTSSVDTGPSNKPIMNLVDDSPISVPSLVKNIENSDSHKNETSYRKLKDEDSHISDYVKTALQDELNLKVSEDKPVHSLNETTNSKAFVEREILFRGLSKQEEKSKHIVDNFVEENVLEKQIDDRNTKIQSHCKRLDHNMRSDEKTNEKRPELNNMAYDHMNQIRESPRSQNATTNELDESVIFISHHSNYVANQLVTEAHNFVAAKEKMLHAHTSCDTNNTPNKNKEDSISDVDISSSNLVDTGIVTSSLKLSNSKIVEDKITVAMNSMNIKEDIIVLKDKSKARTNGFTKSEFVKKINTDKLQNKNNEISHSIESTTATKQKAFQKKVALQILPYDQRTTADKHLSGAKDFPSDKDLSKVPSEKKSSDKRSLKISMEGDCTKDLNSICRVHASYNKVIGKEGIAENITKLAGNNSHHKKDVKIKTVLQDGKSAGSTASREVDGEISTSKLSLSEVPKIKKNLDDTSTLWQVRIQQTSSLAAQNDGISQENNNSKLKDDKNVHDHEESQISTAEISCIKNQEMCTKTMAVGSAAFSCTEPELLRVFARRSIKQKGSDKKTENQIDKTESDNFKNKTSTESFEENLQVVNICTQSTVIKISEVPKPHASKADLKKKSKSFSEKEKISLRTSSPLKEMNLICKEPPTKLDPVNLPDNEVVYRRQRMLSVPDIQSNLASEHVKTLQKESENYISLQKPQGLCPKPNSSLGNDSGKQVLSATVKENQEIINDKEPHAPSWMQLAQQRREQREQRERLLLGGSNNGFADGSSKPARSSKVWDMVNNFQKLQMT